MYLFVGHWTEMAMVVSGKKFETLLLTFCHMDNDCLLVYDTRRACHMTRYFPTASITETGCDESPLCYLTIRAPYVMTDVQTLVHRQQRNNQNQTLDIKSARHVTGGAHFLAAVTLSGVTFSITQQLLSLKENAVKEQKTTGKENCLNMAPHNSITSGWAIWKTSNLTLCYQIPGYQYCGNSVVAAAPGWLFLTFFRNTRIFYDILFI